MSTLLATSLDKVPELMLNAKQRQGLATLGCQTLGDLVLHLPHRYEDRQQFDAFPNQPMDHAVCLCGVVTDIKQRFVGRRRFFEVTVENPDPGPFDGPLICRWFGMPWIGKTFAVDQQIVFYGKAKRSGQRLVMDHPDFELVEDLEDSSSIHLGRITPVYPLTSGVNQRSMREWQHHICGLVRDEDVLDRLPPEASFDMTRWQALQAVHFPETESAPEAARRYLALEEFTQFQLTVLARREDYRRQQGQKHCGEGGLLEKFYASLPFDPTGAQRNAVVEIRQDLASNMPMNRLLQGDVGSGKTLVALASMLLAVEDGYQAVLMAPTQILAEQHFLTFQKWLDPLGLRVGLRTADRIEDGFLPLIAGGEEPQILVGTHALLFEKAQVSDQLGLVVVDEQHKFGVLQRGQLMERASRPDVLVMTATPIPRTLTMTLYGDLDVSIVSEMPKGRGKLVTAVRTIDKTPDVARFMKKQIAEGRQAYIVYPLIEESEKLKLANATQAHEGWVKELGDDITCGLLHGRMTSEEKEAIMARFRSGEMQVLVSTTVIEVGVDVPNANLMLIYHAERFGLAQLHQLRGRVGRGEHKSYCALMCEPGNNEGQRKLAILTETRDGFRISEADLKRRGPGDILGTAQSGLPDLRMVSYLTDTELVQQSRTVAQAILAKDPHLELLEHQAMRNAVQQRQGTLANVS